MISLEIIGIVNKAKYAFGAGLLAMQLSGTPALSDHYGVSIVNEDPSKRYVNQKKVDYLSLREKVYTLFKEKDAKEKIKQFAADLLNSGMVKTPPTALDEIISVDFPRPPITYSHMLRFSYDLDGDGATYELQIIAEGRGLITIEDGSKFPHTIEYMDKDDNYFNAGMLRFGNFAIIGPFSVFEVRINTQVTGYPDKKFRYYNWDNPGHGLEEEANKKTE